ncbi:MAG TPA: CAAX prenyl protease-related protein [Gemmatales bacterium]|nr:CAAX prenyl protease-related protein [Gemmatales bacterium]
MSEPAPFRWQPMLAFVLPFLLFVLFTSLEAIDLAKPWYPWAYLIKVLCVAQCIYFFRREYPFFRNQGLGLSLVVGLLGGVVWIILSTWSFEQSLLPSLVAKLSRWLNMPSLVDWIKPGSRVGYNPFDTLGGTMAWAFICLRLLGMVIFVPLLEEFFWRGFLNRIIQAEHWEEVPWGQYSAASFIIISLAFVAVHTEWTAAIVWIIGINILYGFTRNIWSCIVAHAASNAVLAYYILTYQQWHLW